jgi:DinB superfamily
LLLALIATGGVEVEVKERSELIRRYREGHRAVVAALEGLDEAELDRSASDEWTPRMIAHHLADSEMMSAIRLRRLLAEDSPVIHGYDEAEFARKLTSDRPIEPSLEAMRWARESSAQLLERMSEDDWRRAGTHSESGPYSVEDWLRIYAKHGHDHAKQVERSRGRS